MSLILTDPLNPSADRDRRARARPRRRWELWRSPDDQPSWARPALLGIAGAAAVLYAWNITRAGYAPFYSVAVKSMSVSWKAFFYGAFDPKATITIDKLAGSFLPQALSARIFGFSAWSLALPQVVEGVIAVLAMYRVVRRWAGVAPGLLAAGIFTLTPVAASMFGHSMEDGALTMCLVLAADACQRAVGEARLRSLAWSGVWVGLGFQAKMLQAWMVLPALAVGYLAGAPARLRRRLWHLGAAGAVMLAVSLSWIALYTFTPAGDRPYVDGSTDNSAVAMVFGYNGLERFGIAVKGAVTSGPGVTAGGSGGPAGTRAGGVGAPGDFGGSSRAGSGGQPGFPGAGADLGAGTGAGAGAGAGTGTGVGAGPGQSAAEAPGGRSGGAAAGGGFSAPGGAPGGAGGPGGAARPGTGGGFGTGWTKLLGNEYAPEIGWLYPLAVLALIFGLAWTRRDRQGRQSPRAGQVRAGFVMWGAWLATFGLVFSEMSTIPHTAYMSSLAPPLAALSAAGIVMFWRAYRGHGWRGWVLPAAVAAELAWALFLWRDYGGFLPWARDAMAAAGAGAVVVLAAARLARRRRAVPGAPRPSRGPALLVTAGLAAGVAAMLAAPAAWAASVLDTAYGGSSFNASAGPVDGMGGGGLTQSATTTLTAAEQRIYAYVSAHRDGASYLMAVGSWSQASPYILATGQEVVDMGGFSGSVPAPTLAAVKELVRTGQLRFFLLGGAGPGAGFAAGGRGSASAAIGAWVRSACTEVPAKDYGAPQSIAAVGIGFSAGAQALYACNRNG